MQSLEVFQSMWAMEQRRPDGFEWSLPEKITMIVNAGFNGVDIVQGHFAVDEIKPLLREHGSSCTVTAFPKGHNITEALSYASDMGARHLNVIGQVYPPTIAEGASYIRSWMAQAKTANVPLTIETHRDCITNDLLYTLQLMETVPEMRLCADLSHFVVGREFSWPISETVHQQIAQVMKRSDAFQGRVASREQIQLQLTFPQHQDWVDLFQDWWRQGFMSWRRQAPKDATLNFLCELGPKEYAMTGPDGYEMSDRFSEAIQIKQMVKDIWVKLEKDEKNDQ